MSLLQGSHTPAQEEGPTSLEYVAACRAALKADRMRAYVSTQQGLQACSMGAPRGDW